MKRSPIPLLVLLLLTWSVANYLWFDAWNQRSEKLRKSVDAFESVESDFDEYSALKIAPPLPEELANSLAEFRSEKASDYLREAFADIDCVLVTKPVYEGGCSSGRLPGNSCWCQTFQMLVLVATMRSAIGSRWLNQDHEKWVFGWYCGIMASPSSP
jgi:hypothetical protein